MPNRITRGMALVGSVRGAKGGKAVFAQTNTLARTDTAAKTLFTLPTGAIPIELTVFIPTASDAGTTATINVGKGGGNGHEYLNAYDVKGNSGQQQPTAALLLGTQLAADTPITGVYAETGTASTTGGPFTVVIQYV